MTLFEDTATVWRAVAQTAAIASITAERGARLPGKKPLIVYLQFTNPAGYPPLEHSSRILADSGWDVLFLGAAADGADSLGLPPHPAISVRRFPAYGHGLAQRANYLAFIAWVLVQCLCLRPRWVYASDPLSCLAALAVRRVTGCKTIYHEHDSPIYSAGLSRMLRIVGDARLRLAQLAELCILPQIRRIEMFVADTGRTGPTACVWNCPARAEVMPTRSAPRAGQPLVFHYHGSLNAERLPPTILEALSMASDSARLTIVGYETVGSRGFISKFLGRAEYLGLGKRVTYLGALPLRTDMLAAASLSDVGLAFMPTATSDLNMAHMAGASNKPFEYLAVGQMLLVSDLSDWRAMFVEPGYALSCDPYNIGSLARAMRWCVENSETVRAMGEAGRQRVLAEWNYETCFAPVALKLGACGAKAFDPTGP
jgi:glycosyltransferase involved in cell wall biosynthesis